MSFGGGGGGGAATISPSKEYSKILNVFQQQALPAYNQWQGTQPLLGQATGLAEQQYGALPYYQQGLSQAYLQGQAATAPLPGMIQSAYQSATPESALASQVQGAYGGATPTSQLTGPLTDTLKNYLTPIIQSGGVLQPDQARLATQQALGASAQAGMGNTQTGVFNVVNALNRAREARYGTALNQAMGIGQDVSGLDTAALQRALASSQGIEALNQGALGRAQGAAGSLYTLGQAPFNQALQFANAQQGLAGQTAQGLYSAEQMPISAYGSLFNPVGQNVSQVIGYNLNAQNQANTAAANKTGSTIGGAGSAIGGIAGGLGSYLGGV